MDALKAYHAASWPKGKDIREAMFNLSEKYSSYVPKLSEAVRTKVEGLLKLRLEGPQTKEGQEEEIVADAAAEAMLGLAGATSPGRPELCKAGGALSETCDP